MLKKFSKKSCFPGLRTLVYICEIPFNSTILPHIFIVYDIPIIGYGYFFKG